MLEWYLAEDARDLKRSELNELVENLTCLNALEGKFWKINPKIVTDEKSWKTWKSNQKIVMNEELVQNGLMNEELVQIGLMNEELVQNGLMNEELVQMIMMNEKLVQNGVMHEKFVKNFVMHAIIDPKVVMDLSIFNSLQPSSQQLLEDFLDAWMLIGIPSRDPFLLTQYLERHTETSDQHMKKLKPLRQGLHVMMRYYVRQHFMGHMNIQEDMRRGENLR